ncbi:MAG: hypothetical protein KGQ58_08410 [Proteobacteria bacterium]|nr:hypothetical protein [Pseudomonadota bacterium]
MSHNLRMRKLFDARRAASPWNGCKWVCFWSLYGRGFGCTKGIELMGYLEHMSSAKMLEKFEALLPWNLHVLDLTNEMVS